MQSLTSTQQQELLKTLLKLQSDLIEQLEIGEAATAVVKLDQTSVGRVSRMDALQQQSMAISTRRKVEIKLRRVKTALQALQDGNYGFCQQCDETIAAARLAAQPEAGFCLKCQDQLDRQQ
jgi:DnaK suppressor protein